MGELPRRVAVYGGTFSPPGLHHRRIVEGLRRQFDHVIVVPCGPRSDKPCGVDPLHRAAMTDLAFRDMPGVEVDLFDLEQATFTRTHDLERRYAARAAEVWHVVGTDLIAGGQEGRSFIHRIWEQGASLWERLNFAVISREGHHITTADLPPRHMLLAAEPGYDGSSYTLRERLFRSEAVDTLLDPKVMGYVRRHGLYLGGPVVRAVRQPMSDPRLLLSYDQRNPRACQWAERFRQYERADDPNFVLVIGGDGSMLHAIQRYWRLRVPFFGVNAGHLGFLLNKPEEVLDRFPLPEVISRPMPLLYIEMQLKDGTWQNGLTFNDAWVERSTGQTAWLEVKIDGRPRLPKLVCDGALLSTAAGSTAYARSMGAQPLLADTPAWLLVGSNVMQPVNWKSALLSLDATVEITNLDPVKRPLNGFIYGLPVGEVVAARARVSRIAAVELAFCPSHDITEKIAQIQFPGASANLPGL